MRRSWRFVSRVGVLVFMLVGAACGDDDRPDDTALCDAARLTSALAAASAGDTVIVGACTIDGQFTVPAGVELRGAGAAASLVRSDAATALTLETGTGTTRLTDLGVRSDGVAAVLARGTGTGAVTLEGVKIDATRGIGVGVEGLASVSLTDVELAGPVTVENAESFDPPWSSADVATVGLAVFGSPEVTVATTSVHGFAYAGAILVDAGTTWTGGSVEENLSSGLQVKGGSLSLASLEVRQMLVGAGLYPAWGIVVAGGTAFTTNGLVVEGCEGVGILHDGVDAEHVDLVVRDNERVGLWAQNAGSVRLTGAASEVTGNGLAGLFLASVQSAELRDARIADTQLVPTIPDGQADPVDMGDGLLLRDSVDDVTLADLTVENNGRAGILIDLGGGSTAGYTFDSVAVNGTGDQLGCIGQNGDLLDGWAAGVERLGATAVNDAAVVDPLGVTHGVQPADLPTAALTDLAALLE